MKRSSTELKRYAKATLKGKWGTFVSTSAIYLIIVVASVLIPNRLFRSSYGTTSFIIKECISLILSVVTQLFYAGLNSQAMKACRKQTISVKDLFYVFSHNPDRFIKVALVQVLMSTFITFPLYFIDYLDSFDSSGIGTLIFITLYIFYIVATVFLIILTLAFALRFYLLIDYPHMSAMNALKTSWKLMKGNKGRAFYLSFSFFGWIILGVATFGIGMLWINPYINATTAFLYFDIIGALDAPVSPEPVTKAPAEQIVHEAAKTASEEVAN